MTQAGGAIVSFYDETGGVNVVGSGLIDASGVVTAAVTGRHVRLLWYPPESADLGGFRIYRRSPEDPGFVPVAEVPGSEVMFTDREVRPGTEYLYRVVSFSRIDPQRESEAGEAVSAHIDADPGDPPGEEE